MLLIKETSKGPVTFDYLRAFGDRVTINHLDSEGWGVNDSWWEPNDPKLGTLAEAIAREADLPLEEAEPLADDVNAEWHRRAPDEPPAGRAKAIGLAISVPLIAAVGLIPLLVIGGIIWLVVKLL